MGGCLNVEQTIYQVGPKEVSYSGLYTDYCLLRGRSSLGSSADNIVSHFAVNYHNEAEKLGISLNDLYSALLADGELNPPEWNIQGRQINVYK